MSADSDDASSAKHKTDDPFEEIDNFEMIAPNNGNGAATQSGCHLHNQHHNHRSSTTHEDDGGGGGAGDVCCTAVCPGIGDSECGLCGGNDLQNSCLEGSNINNGRGHCTATDCQGNYADSKLCQFNMNNTCGGGGVGVGGMTTNGTLKVTSSTSSARLSSKELNENTINRLQSMAMSDDDDYGE